MGQHSGEEVPVTGLPGVAGAQDCIPYSKAAGHWDSQGPGHWTSGLEFKTELELLLTRSCLGGGF